MLVHIFKKSVLNFFFTKEIAFKQFLFTNITKFRFSFCEVKSFKDHDVYIINFFRISHTLKRNLTKLVYVRQGFGRERMVGKAMEIAANSSVLT